ARLDQGVDRSRPVPAGVGTAERPIAPADRNSAHGPFGGIIRQADAAVVEEAGEGRPSVQTVIDGLGDFALRRDAIALFTQPGFECGDERLGSLLTHGEPLFWRAAVDLPLDLEQFVDAPHGLAGNRRVRQLREFEEFSPPMSPPGGFLDRRGSSSSLMEFVVSGISVSLHDPGPPGEMRARIFASARARVVYGPMSATTGHLAARFRRRRLSGR